MFVVLVIKTRDSCSLLENTWKHSRPFSSGIMFNILHEHGIVMIITGTKLFCDCDGIIISKYDRYAKAWMPHSSMFYLLKVCESFLLNWFIEMIKQKWSDLFKWIRLPNTKNVSFVVFHTSALVGQHLWQYLCIRGTKGGLTQSPEELHN